MCLFAYFVVDFKPFLIQFTENFGIRYYGLAYIAGFIVGYWLLRRYTLKGRSSLTLPQIGDLMVAVVLGVILGGRLGYFLLYQLGDLRTDPWALFRVWNGGMASHGGFIGVTIAMVWFSRSIKIPFLYVADLISSTAAAGLFFGRLANFINGELWGKVSYVSWAMIFPHSAVPGTPIEHIAPRHPSQLYEAALEGAVLFAFTQWRFWRTDVVRRQPGRLGGEFLVVYAIARVICEIFRQPDEGVDLLFGLSRGTFYSLFFIAVGAFLILRPTKPAPSQAR